MFAMKNIKAARRMTIGFKQTATMALLTIGLDIGNAVVGANDSMMESQTNCEIRTEN